MKFGIMKNNRLLCSCKHIPNDRNAIVVYRQLESLCEPLRTAKYRIPAVCVCSARGLFFNLSSLCKHRTKLATHCPSARRLAHFLKQSLILSWPPMPLTHSVSIFSRYSRRKNWRPGVTDWKNAYRILGLFTTSAAAIYSACSALQTSQITFNHCQP